MVIFIEECSLTIGQTTEQKLALPHWRQTVSGASDWDGTLWGPSLSMLGVDWPGLYGVRNVIGAINNIDLLPTVTAALIHECNGPLCVQRYFVAIFPSFWLNNLSTPSSAMFPEPWLRKEVWHWHSIRSEHSVLIYALHFDWLYLYKILSAA